MAVERKRTSRAGNELQKVASPQKKVNLKEAKAVKVKADKKDVNPKAPRAKNSNTVNNDKEKATKGSQAPRPSTAKENKEPPARSRKTSMASAPNTAAVAVTVAPAASAASAASRGVKRQRISKDDVNAAKRAKIDEVRLTLRKPLLDKIAEKGGVVLTVGTGDTGQLGLGEDVMDCKMPKLVSKLQDNPVVAVCAGGMHTLCLTKAGVVYSFGCNDDGALGRITEEDEETYTPGEVTIPGKVVMVSAGDSHAAALTDEGKVFFWGTFRDNSGTFGLTPDGKNHSTPIPLAHHLKVKKIVSGENHIVLLTENGHLFSLGCAEQGRLGRIGELFASRGGRRGLALLLTPEEVHAKNRHVAFADVWSGSMSTVALTTDNEVLVCGLNNYNQLGITNRLVIYTMTISPAFTKIAQEHGLAQVTFGQHHILLLDARGKVYVIGRHDYGVLGLGEGLAEEVKVPRVLEGNLSDKSCVEIGCGSSVSFALTTEGSAFSWGMGTNQQLAQPEDDDVYEPTAMRGQQLNGKKVVSVSGGGQHTVLLAQVE